MPHALIPLSDGLDMCTSAVRIFIALSNSVIIITLMTVTQIQ